MTPGAKSQSTNPYAASQATPLERATDTEGDMPVPPENLGRATNVRWLIVTMTTLTSIMLYLDRVCISQTQGRMKEELGLDNDQMAWILGSFFLTYALCQVPAGWLADRFGARSLMTMFVIGWSVATCVTGLATGFIMLFVSRMVFGIMQAGAYPASGGLLSKWIEFPRRGIASSIVALGGRAGGALANLITPGLMVAFDALRRSQNSWWSSNVTLDSWQLTYQVFGLFGVVVGIAFWIIYRNRPEEHPWSNAAEHKLIKLHIPPGAESSRAGRSVVPILGLVSSPSMWLMCIGQWTTNIGWVFLITWMPRFLTETMQRHPSYAGMSQGEIETEVGMMSTITLFGGMVGLFIGGWITDRAARQWGKRWGRAVPMAGSKVVAVCAYIALLFIEDPWVAVAAFTLVSFATDLGIGATWAYMQDVGGRNVGSVLGWGNMWGNLGAAVSPILLQKTIDWWDPDKTWHAPFIVCAASFVVSGLVSLGINAEKPIQESTRRELVIKDPDFYRKDARNIVWAIAFLAFIPTLVLLALTTGGLGGNITWDVLAIGYLSCSLVLSTIGIVAGILCGKGKRSGRFLAFFPAAILFLCFPIGTIFAVPAFIKLNKKEFVESLD